VTGRVAVLGGGGFLGSHLCDQLIARGDEVVCIDDFSTGRRANVAHLDGAAGFHLIEADVSESIPVDGAVTGVFNLASPASPPDYLARPLETLAVGSGVTVTVVAWVAEPPGPVQVKVYVAFAVRAPVGCEPLGDFGKFCREKNAPALAVYDVDNLEEIKKYNSISTDAQGKITFFEEKPKNPVSTLTGIALYYYPKSAIALIKQYIAEGNNPDQPGRLVQWLYPRTPVYTWRVPGLWFDIGSKETLEEANKIFAKF